MTDKQMIRVFVVLLILAGIAGCGEHRSPDRAMDNSGIVGGGAGNEAGGEYATVCGGFHNSANASRATIGGGSYNTAEVEHSTVSGGFNNIASGTGATVGGGHSNTAAARLNATVGGGYGNKAIGSRHPTVSGGLDNVASGYGATVGGGSSNSADGINATIGGGAGNKASGCDATIGGGAGNHASGNHATASGGLANRATDIYATVGGGYGNIASGAFSTVPGGFENEAAGDYSFTSGHRAKVDAAHNGVFLHADSNDFDFHSKATDEFAVRATGGVRFITAIDNDGNPIAGVELAPGSGSWSSLSDRALKANVVPVDGNQILLLLAEIPITTWNYIGQDRSVRHIGPMAQDFHAVFGVGENDRHISTIDADGVALAAIQGLYRLVQEKDAQIAALEARVTALEHLCLDQPD